MIFTKASRTSQLKFTHMGRGAGREVTAFLHRGAAEMGKELPSTNGEVAHQVALGRKHQQGSAVASCASQHRSRATPGPNTLHLHGHEHPTPPAPRSSAGHLSSQRDATKTGDWDGNWSTR